MSSEWQWIFAIIVLISLSVLVTRTNPKSGRPKKKVYQQLVSGKPISPKHQRPPIIGDEYGLADDADRLFFSDFFEFGDVMNWWLADQHVGSRWRIQELPKTELSIDFRDSPEFGRTYEIFCGPIKLGCMEISASSRYERTKKVQASIELEWVRLLSWDNLTSFLSAVATHVNSADDFNNFANIQGSMSRCLWDSLVVRDQDLGLDWGSLEVTLQGMADFYFSRKDSKGFREGGLG
jgi:hypothetical protein